MQKLLGWTFVILLGSAVGYGLHTYHSPFWRLSARVEADTNLILSPLDDDPALPVHELKELRREFCEGLSSSRRQYHPRHDAAIAACDLLLQAIEERQRYKARLKSSRLKPSSNSLDRGAEVINSRVIPTDHWGNPGGSFTGHVETYAYYKPAYDNHGAAQRNAYFEGVITQDWEQKAQNYRARSLNQRRGLNAAVWQNFDIPSWANNLHP